VAAGALGWVSAEIAREVIAGRVDDADGDAAPGLLDREPQVAVVRDHEGGVDLAAEDVQEEVRGEVDFGAFLFAVRAGHHEHRAEAAERPAIDSRTRRRLRPPGYLLMRLAPGLAPRAGPAGTTAVVTVLWTLTWLITGSRMGETPRDE
jgi:hypothetical protein